MLMIVRSRIDRFLPRVAALAALLILHSPHAGLSAEQATVAPPAFASQPARPGVKADGQPASLVPLGDAASRLGAELFWDPLSQTAVLSKNGHLVNFRSGDPVVLFDYRQASVMDPPVRGERGVFLSASFVNRLDSFFDTLPEPVAYRVGAILIDPGHGGKDPGAVGTCTIDGKRVQLLEKDIALTVARDLHQRLSRRYPDKKILLTREGDTYPSLEDRVDMANSVKLEPHEAILYLSVHVNSGFNQSSSGFEVWYLPPDYRRTVIDRNGVDAEEILPILNTMMEEEFTTESILIAKSIQDGLARSIGPLSKNRGIKEESWFVVRNARMPSVLVELGFLNNPAEAALLASPDYLQKCSGGIYNGLTSFITQFEGSRGFTSTQ